MANQKSDLPASAQTLIERLKNRDATIAVVGLGYVGLPLAVTLAKAGFRVRGIDADPAKITALCAGQSYVEDIPDAVISELIEEGRFIPSSEHAELKDVEGVSICVPTPLRKTGDPDLSYIVNATRSLKEILHPGMVVILESTTYPGTTREIVQPEVESTGLKVGSDIFLAFSPERVDPGRTDWTTSNTPKVIGGVTPACTAVAGTLYSEAMDDVVQVSSTEVAEMTKLLENTFRAVNIGLVNELAIMCHRLGIDVWEVIDAASTKPFGFMRFTPGPGLGGHCIPIDPIYLSWKLKSVKYNARFIELASEINTNMPRFVVQRLQDALNKDGKPVSGAKILILGVAYKPNVSDTRESPAIDVIGLLQELGATVSYFDPYVPHFDHDDLDMHSEPDLEKAVKAADCVVIITDHDEVDYAGVVKDARLVFDTRNVIQRAGLSDEKVVKL